MRINRLLILITFVLSSITPVLARDTTVPMTGPVSSPAQVNLLSPIGDMVTLTDRDSLDFRWLNELGIDHSIFKLYKGYNMYESDLIYTETLPSNQSLINVKSDSFEDGQVYTWSVVQVSPGGQKSEKSFSSFKVINKARERTNSTGAANTTIP